jgi:indolepyruvate decarboxylase
MPKSPRYVASAAARRRRAGRPAAAPPVRDFNTQREIFEKITVASTSLDDPLTAFREIDRRLAACGAQRPVYLELPRDRVRTKCLYPVRTWRKSRSATTGRARLDEAAEMINGCQKPIIIAGSKCTASASGTKW